MHAIMVEDATTVRMFYRSILEAAGFSVVEAMNGMEALERAAGGGPTPDLFLVDVNMPVMDGYTFLRRIRCDVALRDIPAIVISTMREKRDEERAFEAGANLVLVKPACPNLLTCYVRALSGAECGVRLVNQETELLLRQFIPEARDLLDQAGRSLLALERTPSRAEPLNELFRAVHTLKGTSGLFAIEPLTRLVHAAEDLLFAVQAGHMTLAPELADTLLESLDQVGLWIDSLAETSILPDDAEAASETWVTRLRTLLGKGSSSTDMSAVRAPVAPSALPVWLEGLSCDAPGAGGQLIAIRYSPDAHCFFRGEDPLGLLRQIPGLRALRLDPVDPWPPIADVDPFLCNVSLRAIVDTPYDEVEHLLRYALDQVELVVLPNGWPNGAVADPGHKDGLCHGVILAILNGQRRLLSAVSEPEAAFGHRAAAARALRGLLVHLGRADLVTGLDEACASGEADPILSYIDVIASALDPATLLTSASSGEVAMVGRAGETENRPLAALPPATLRVEQGKIDVMMNLIGEVGGGQECARLSRAPCRAGTDEHQRTSARDQGSPRSGEPHRRGHAGGRDVGPHAAGRANIPAFPASGARCVTPAWQTRRACVGGRRDQSRQEHHRGHRRPLDPYGPQQPRSWDRVARGPPAGGQARARHALAEGIAGQRRGVHPRDRRWTRHRPGCSAGQSRRARADR